MDHEQVAGQACGGVGLQSVGKRLRGVSDGLLMLAGAGAGLWLGSRLLRTLTGYQLRGKVALVTGGSRGLGLVLARELAREGAHVAICARDPEELERAFRDLHGRTERVLAIPCDLTSKSEVESMVGHINARWGRLDVIVNNAGTITVGPVESMTLADYQQAMEANFWSAVHTTLAALPGMRARREGRIVNITSIGGKLSVPHLVPYSASKFAFVGWSQGLRAELAKDGIVVTTICPGLMRNGSASPMLNQVNSARCCPLKLALRGLPGRSSRPASAAMPR